MWKNFPLPPWGIALVKKNLCPSLEKSGGSFWREETSYKSVPAGLFISLSVYLFMHTRSKKKSLFFSQLDFSIFHHIPVGATNSHSHPHVSEKNKSIWAESLIQQIGGKWKDTSQKVLHLQLCKKESFHWIAQSCESFLCADMSCLVSVKHYGHFGLDCAEDIIPEVL